MTKQLTLILCLLGGCAASEQAAKAPPPAANPQIAAEVKSVTVEPAPSQAALTRVTDPSTVCMVNNRYMGSPQIPVIVDGKTYYGCCKMCEKRLQEEDSVRQAVDPVLRTQVDKAVALMARDASGNIFYFADEASFASATK